MRIRQLALAVAGLSLVTGAAMTGQATAAVQGKPQPPHRDIAKALKQIPMTKAQAAAAACGVQVGGVTAAGLNGGYDITATKPVTAKPFQQYKLFGIRASSSWYYYEPSSTVNYLAGFVLQSGNLYAAAETYKNGSDIPVASSRKLGTGWTGFSALASANYYNELTGAGHLNLYGLHANGSLYRYSVKGPTGPVASYGSAPGYKSFKAITAIASTATYDTLLATTKQGALWTIRIPTVSPMKGTLKAVRTTGFAAYDQIIAQRCGASSTLLTGFNNTTNTAAVFAMSKANGSKTVINTIGSFAAPQDANTHFLYTGSGGPQLVGE
ncbi:hypothetical protein [Kribbella sp. CA-293567]|uniref:hypothetical protein n=1 Tax=Kribbella sp. CA-293567 TaxID=3002436 RepID=UPI0022DE7A7B|nr:hypothetical protein [Kribbella sp. CA-293567]WBQ03530.1 hypothetical protein OX958_26585 [Kribbella sp. CA-293567]